MAERTCRGCGVELTRKPGPGRWPAWCDACRAVGVRRNPQRPAVCRLRFFGCGRCGKLQVGPAGVGRSVYCSTCAVYKRRERNRRKMKKRSESKRARLTQTLASCDLCDDPVLRRGVSRCPRHVGIKTTSAVRYAECECGRLYIQRGARKFCSERCARVWYNLRSGRSYSVCPVAYGDCVECGSCFVRRVRQVGAFCGASCERRARKRDRRHRQRSSGGESERITISSLGDRDRWTCHICAKRVTRRRGNSDSSPSIDHLVPLSRGGKHAWTNVALAHRICNSRRGTGGEVQLLLVG